MHVGRFVDSSDADTLRLSATRRLHWLRTWIAELDTPALSEGALCWVVYAVLFRVEACLLPADPLRGELKGLFDASLRDPISDVAERLRAVAARDDVDLLPSLESAGPAGDAPRITPRDVTRHVDVIAALKKMQRGRQRVGALCTALYGPTYLLAFHAMDRGLAELLTLPLRVVDHGLFREVDAGEGLVDPDSGALDAAAIGRALTSAVQTCREVRPAVRRSLSDLDLSSPTAFVASFAAALLKADLDPDAAPADDLAGTPDWTAVEDRLFAESVGAIERFAEAHPHETVCFVAFDASPYDGAFNLCFDTTDSVESRARGTAEQLVHQRQCRWSEPKPDAWKTAKSAALAWQPVDYDPELGDFEHPLFHDIIFDWEAFVRSDAYARLNRGGEDGWLEGHMRIVLARVCDRLVGSDALSRLRRAHVLRLGYQYHGEAKAIVCRIVWSSDS